jgi:hypothetical protein
MAVALQQHGRHAAQGFGLRQFATTGWFVRVSVTRQFHRS